MIVCYDHRLECVIEEGSEQTVLRRRRRLRGRQWTVMPLRWLSAVEPGHLCVGLRRLEENDPLPTSVTLFTPWHPPSTAPGWREREASRYRCRHLCQSHAPTFCLRDVHPRDQLRSLR